LRWAMQWVPRLTLEKRPVEEVVQGALLQEHKKEIEGKTEEELIQMAGPATASIDTRLIAVYELEVSVSRSNNRLDIYLLAINDIRDDASSRLDLRAEARRLPRAGERRRASLHAAVPAPPRLLTVSAPEIRRTI